MGLALKDMIPFLVLAFMLGQFIALFDWSTSAPRSRWPAPTG